MAERGAAASGASAQPPRRKVLLPALLATLVAAAVVAGCSAMRKSLVYPATHYDHAEFERRVSRAFAGRASVLAPYDAIVVEAPAAAASAAVATAIYFHGNGDVNTQLAALAPVFAQRRMRLVLAEYPGYGARPGEPSERALVDDARSLYAAVADRDPASPIIVLGQSLGSGVAAQMAADPGPARAPVRLVLITPFLNLAEAASHSAWGLPVGALFSERYDSAAALARYAGPVAVLVAGRDRLLGPEQGRRLAQAPRVHGATLLVEIAEADHNTWFRAMTEARWDALLAAAPAR